MVSQLIDTNTYCGQSPLYNVKKRLERSYGRVIRTFKRALYQRKFFFYSSMKSSISVDTHQKYVVSGYCKLSTISKTKGPRAPKGKKRIPLKTKYRPL